MHFADGMLKITRVTVKWIREVRIDKRKDPESLFFGIYKKRKRKGETKRKKQ